MLAQEAHLSVYESLLRECSGRKRRRDRLARAAGVAWKGRGEGRESQKLVFHCVWLARWQGLIVSQLDQRLVSCCLRLQTFCALGVGDTIRVTDGER